MLDFSAQGQTKCKTSQLLHIITLKNHWFIKAHHYDVLYWYSAKLHKVSMRCTMFVLKKHGDIPIKDPQVL